MLTGNDKRKASCKAVGGEKKRGGHKLEHVFNEQFGVPSSITYKAEADCLISSSNPAGALLMKELQKTLSLADAPTCSLKSGNNLQFTLGCIPEITETENKLDAMYVRSLWEKYLGKSESAAPANLLVYRMKEGKWMFFSMNEVLDFIVEKCKWRELATGRLKGDFVRADGKSNQFLTYEFRTTHKSHFLGANGNKGLAFIQLLQSKLRHYIV